MTSGTYTIRNKVIYIISSEFWGIMHVSKHHYALELAKRGNEVYYIEPPLLTNTGVDVKKYEGAENLYIVKYKPVMRGRRFLPSFIYRLLIKQQIGLLKRAIGKQPGIVWSFDAYRFEYLSLFKAGISIFHPVDFFTRDELPLEAKTADICFSSSLGIKQVVEKGGRPTYFINHGLNDMFCRLATAAQSGVQQETLNRPVRVGYIGNLLMEALDRKTMRQVIENNPQLEFHFWGQVEKGTGGLAGFNSAEVDEFIHFLKSCKHVRLYGPVPIFQLYDELMKMDLFWICWHLRKSKIWNENTNPHKILEYLSTGKPLVSHCMNTYLHSELIDMLPTVNNDEYLALFQKVVNRVQKGEPLSLQRKRIEMALQNAYPVQIENIEKLVQQHIQQRSGRNQSIN